MGKVLQPQNALPPRPTAGAHAPGGEPATAEALGWQLRAALPPRRLHTVSLYDSQGNVLWLSEGALGPDEHSLVVDALDRLTTDSGKSCCENRLEVALRRAQTRHRSDGAGPLARGGSAPRGRRAARRCDRNSRAAACRAAQRLAGPRPRGAHPESGQRNPGIRAESGARPAPRPPGVRGHAHLAGDGAAGAAPIRASQRACAPPRPAFHGRFRRLADARAAFVHR